MRCYKVTMGLIYAALGGIGLTTAVAASDRSAEDLIAALKAGGHVVYIRHAKTESDYADQVSAILGNCSTQRVLSEEGWRQAKTIGAEMRKHAIPIADVFSSEYCRAWQTADLAFGRYTTTDALNFEPAENYSPAQVETMANNVRPLLVEQETGNRVIVGHDDPFEAVSGIYPEPQGVTFVLKPKVDGTIEVLGSIAPDGWP